MRNLFTVALAATFISTTLAGQGCITRNTNTVSGLTGQSGMFAMLATTGATAKTICGLTFYCRARTTAGPRTWFVFSRSSTGNNSPLAVLRSGSVHVGTTNNAYAVTFPALALPANTQFYVGFDNRQLGGLVLPISTSGTNTVHYYKPGFNTTWNGPFSQVRFSYSLQCCGSSPGVYSFYGAGCTGSGAGSCNQSCVSANWANPFNGLTGASANFAIRANTGASARTICGLQFQCQARTTPQTTSFSIYSANSLGHPGTVLRTGTVNVGTAAATYTATFTPVTIAANTRFYCVIFNKAGGLILPIMGSGSNQVHYFNGPPSWNGPFTSVPWNYSVLCSGPGGRAVPLLANDSNPNIGKPFGLTVSKAKPNSLVMIFYGASKAQWNGIPLPLDLGIIGAGGCSLLASYDTVFGTRSDATGKASFNATIPSNPAFVGVSFFNQAWVADPGVNPAGLAMTRGGAGKVGNQ